MPDPISEIPVYPFGFGRLRTTPDPLVHGNKGAGLVAMSALGLPVPPGFIVGTQTGRRIAREGEPFRRQVSQAVRSALRLMEGHVGRTFGKGPSPYLLSVRSGAAISMPGMMDTVLNVGLNDTTTDALAVETGSERFAWDTHRRFVQSYSTVVLGIDPNLFDSVMEEARARRGVETDGDLPTKDLRALTEAFREIVAEESGEAFPDDVEQQLERAMVAVFESWNSPSAKRFREISGIDGGSGTAAVVQSMVFGNRDKRSCTGVYNTRNPSTGANEPWGEYMPVAQGEDVVGGAHTGYDLTLSAATESFSTGEPMETAFPLAFRELLETGCNLESHFRSVQEIEFTVECDRLFVLQTRSAKLQPLALAKAVVDMAGEGIISREEAVSLSPPAILREHLIDRIAAGADRPLAKGLAASPGAVSGQTVFTSDAAVALKEQGGTPILVRPTTDPKDVHGMAASVGILTSRGGLTSHAAVVARSMGKPCITAALSVAIDLDRNICEVMGSVIKAGDTITIDGTTGYIYAGAQPIEHPEPDGDVATLLEWAREQGVEG